MTPGSITAGAADGRLGFVEFFENLNMWVIATIFGLVVVFIFRRQIVRKPRHSTALMGGLLSVIVLWEVFKHDPGYGSTPKWIIALALAVVFVMGVRLFRRTSKDLWPEDGKDRKDVR